MVTDNFYFIVLLTVSCKSLYPSFTFCSILVSVAQRQTFYKTNKAAEQKQSGPCRLLSVFSSLKKTLWRSFHQEGWSSDVQAAEPKFLSGIALNRTANLVFKMTQTGSAVAQEALWKLSFMAVKGCTLGVRAPPQRSPSPVPHLHCQANWNLLC